MNKIPKRSEVKEEFTWKTSDIYPSGEEWENDLKKAEDYPEKILSYKGKISKSPSDLYNYLKLGDELGEKITSLYCYASLNSDADTGDSKYKEMVGRVTTLYVRIAEADSYATPEIMSVDDDKFESFYKDEPKLEEYRRNLTKLRLMKPHTLSEKEEKLLAGASDFADASSKTSSSFRNADLKFPDVTDGKGESHQLTQGSYVPMVESNDRVLRKNAFEALYHTYEGFKNTTADFLDGQFRQLKFFSSARNFGSSLESALGRNEVPTSVYHNLITAVHDNIGLMHRYMGIRKKLMGLDELHMYDIYPNIVNDCDKRITFEEAKKTALEALKPLGEDYISKVRECFENRWIDVYENEGKRGGAYSMGMRPHPYILLNHKDTLDCMFTLIHETGHAMHSYYSMINQPKCMSDYVIFVAEVASTCNESLLMNYLLDTTEDKKEQAYLINYFLEQFRTTLYRQTMFAEFELKANEIVENGGTLTPDALCEIYHNLNEFYYGKDVVIDSEIDMEWARIPHFFMNYYVFQYATGFSAAMALSDKILHGTENDVKNYIGFLSAGSSKPPIEILKDAGVDMSTPKPVSDALKTFEKLLDRFEKLTEDM